MVMLIGNKVDLPDKVITSEMGAEFARQNGWGFLEVSAKTDQGIKAAFKSLITNVYTLVCPNHVIEQPKVATETITLNNQNSKSNPTQDKKKGGCCK